MILPHVYLEQHSHRDDIENEQNPNLSLLIPAFFQTSWYFIFLKIVELRVLLLPDDLKMLIALQDNPLGSYKELAEALDVTPPTAKTRLKKL